MTMEQILLWLLGPGVGSAISWLLDQNSRWADWKPNDLLGFSPKAILVGVGSSLIGLVTYGIATTRPDIINTADPIVQVWFPLLAPIVVQIWHAVVNKSLSSTNISVSGNSPNTISTTVTTKGAKNEVG